MRGIILAGGTGSRLHPLTTVVNKHLLPVHDKPLIFYPLSTMLAMDVREVLLITDPAYLASFRRLLGDGDDLGISLQYATQDEPRGIAHALSLADGFVGEGHTALVLGDNIFHGNDLDAVLSASYEPDKATIFSRRVDDGSPYGVVRTDDTGTPTRLVEKPTSTAAADAVPGLYVYPPDVLDLVSTLEVSDRGELEISDLNQRYLESSRLCLRRLPDDMAWFDAGTVENLSAASQYVRDRQRLTQQLVGSPEVTSWRRGFIDDCKLQSIIEVHAPTEYGRLLMGAMER